MQLKRRTHWSVAINDRTVPRPHVLQKRVEGAKRAAKALAAHAAEVQPGQGYLTKLRDLADRADREIGSAKARLSASEILFPRKSMISTIICSGFQS